MKTKHAYDPTLKKHISFFIFMMLLISIVFLKKVTAQAVQQTAQSHLQITYPTTSIHTIETSLNTK